MKAMSRAGKDIRTANQLKRKEYTNLCSNIHNEEGIPTIYVYDVIDSDPYWGFTALQLAQHLQDIGDAPVINLRINSPGGDVFAANSMYALLTQHSSDIHVYIDGLCASAATYLAAAGSKRVAAEGSFWMVHFALSGAFGNKSDLRKIIAELDKIDNSIAGHYSRLNGDSVDEWLKKMEDETWFNADEALKAGLVDEIWKQDSSNSINANWDLSTYSKAPNISSDDGHNQTGALTNRKIRKNRANLILKDI